MLWQCFRVNEAPHYLPQWSDMVCVQSAGLWHQSLGDCILNITINKWWWILYCKIGYFGRKQIICSVSDMLNIFCDFARYIINAIMFIENIVRPALPSKHICCWKWVVYKRNFWKTGLCIVNKFICVCVCVSVCVCGSVMTHIKKYICCNGRHFPYTATDTDTVVASLLWTGNTNGN